MIQLYVDNFYVNEKPYIIIVSVHVTIVLTSQHIMFNYHIMNQCSHENEHALIETVNYEKHCLLASCRIYKTKI